MKRIIFCIATIFLLSCKEKEKIVNVPVHVEGMLYVNKKMPKSEYIKIMQEKDKEEKEYLAYQEKKKKEVKEWRLNQKQPELKISYPKENEYKEEKIYCDEINVKTEKTKNEGKIVYQAKGIIVRESK